MITRGKKGITCPIMEIFRVILSSLLIMSNNLGTNSQTPKKAAIILFQSDVASYLYCYNICVHSYSLNPSGIFSNVL